MKMKFKRILMFLILGVCGSLCVLGMTSCKDKTNDNPGVVEPDHPDDPDKPDHPDNPDKPDNPDNPDKPDNPDNPDKPDNPDNPGIIYYTVSFDADGGTFTGETKLTVEEGKTVSQPKEPIKLGSYFIGWFNGDEEYNFSSIVKGDLNLKAHYEEDRRTYTVTFNSDGGSAVESISNLKRNEVIDEPTSPTKEGYDFVGWYLDGKLYDFKNPIVKNIRLVARWEKAKVTVSFDSAGGSVVANQKIEGGTKALNPGAPTKTDAKFLGWYLNDELFDFDTIIEENITLTAKWENTYTLTFLNPDASYSWQQVITIKIKENTVLGDDFSNNEDLTNPDAGFSHKDYWKFIGWYADGSDTPFDAASPITMNMTLYAKWDEYYFVSFSNSNEPEIVLAKGDTIADYFEKLGKEVPTPTDSAGHPFDAWYYSGEKFDYTTPVTSNIILTAHYKYYLEFNSIGGTAVERQVVAYGDYGTEPQAPVKEHYHFLGWYYSGQPYIFEANAIVADITVTARWVYVFEGEGSTESPYLLETKADVHNFSDLVNKDSQDPVTGVVYRDAVFKLANDIHMDHEVVNSIVVFAGMLKGDGHAILDFQILTENNARVGFFAHLESTASIMNVKLLDVYVHGDKASSASVGILAGNITGATVYGVEVSGQIILNAARMERAIVGGLAGEVHTATIYGTKVSVVIKGGNVVGGLVGYATDSSTVAASYVDDNSTLELYRTGSLAGLAGLLDKDSIMSSCYGLAVLKESSYTSKKDSALDAIGFGEGAFVNCYSKVSDANQLIWNEQDWNSDLTLKVIPEEHANVTVTVGVYQDEEFNRIDSIDIPYGSTIQLDPIEGEGGTVFVEYRVNGNSSYDMNTPIYSDLVLVPHYGSYDDMTGRWQRTEGEWFDLSVDPDSKAISVRSSIFTGEYDTIGSNFREIVLMYEKSEYETLPYVVYDTYGDYSFTGKYYESVVLYMKRRSTIMGAQDEEYRAYLQRVPAGEYDKAFMRLERLEAGKWNLINDQMLPFASDYSGYYLNGSDNLFIKAPYIPQNGNYNQSVLYQGANTTSQLSYAPFLFIGVQGQDESCIGFTTSSSGGVLADYILVSDGHLLEIYDYETNLETNRTYTESFAYLNANWFNVDDAWDYVYGGAESSHSFKPKDPFYVYAETEKYNHTVSVDENNNQITVDGQTYAYAKSFNENGVAVLSYTVDGQTHLFWADYSYDSMFGAGINYFVHYEVQAAGSTVKSEQWEKYEHTTGIHWVEDQPEEDEPSLSFGDIILTNTTIQFGAYEPVEYDFVMLTDCDGIPGWEVRSFDYLRFVVDGVTYYLRSHRTTNFLYLYYEDPSNPNHLLSKRYKNIDDFKYYIDAYDGEWISKEQDAYLTVDVEAKTINGNAFEFEWYNPTDYDYELLGVTARYYNRVATYTDGVDQYQLRVTFIRKGYAYLYKLDTALNEYRLVQEYFSCSILDKLLGTWNYYDNVKTDTLGVSYDGQYQVKMNGQLLASFLTWNPYNGAPVIAYYYDDGEKEEYIHLVYTGAYGYDLMDALDFDSYDAVFDESEEDMVYRYTNKYLYFKTTTISDVVKTMSGTWTDGSMTVTIKNDEILVLEPNFEPVTLSIAYIYDLPSIYMDQYVVIMVGIDAEGMGSYIFYYYNQYLYASHYVSEDQTTGGTLVRRDDMMVFRGNYMSVGLNESHSYIFDGTSLSVDGHEYDVSYISYGYAQLNDGRIVPVMMFDDVLDLNETTLTAILRSCQVYYIDGVMVISIVDNYVTLEISAGTIGIASYDKVVNLLENEIFYSSDLIKYNGVYEFSNASGTVSSLAINDGYIYVDGKKIDSDVLVLGNGNIQIIFQIDQTIYYATIGIDAYGETVYQIFKMTLV